MSEGRERARAGAAGRAASPMDAARGLPNPFERSVVRGPSEPLAQHEPEVRKEVSRALVGLVERIRSDGRARLQVLTGDPGDGKTHLLCQLRARSIDSFRGDRPFAFAWVDPLRDAERPFGHFLREAAGSLHRPLPNVSPDDEDEPQPASPLERLGFLSLQRAARHLSRRSPGYSAMLAGERTNSHLGFFAACLREAWPELGPELESAGLEWALDQGIEPEVWAVVCRLAVPASRPSALLWLRGSHLAERDLEAHGLPPTPSGEDRAFRALVSLARLSPVPMVIAFDQLEGVRRRGEGAVRALFAALGELWQADAPLLLLVSSQTSVWAEAGPGLERQILDRIEPPIDLPPLTPAEIVALAASRLEPFWARAGQRPPSPTHPFSAAALRALALPTGTITTPRMALRHLASAWAESSAAPAREPRASAAALYAEAVRREAARERERAPEQRAAAVRGALQISLERACERGVPLAGAKVSAVEAVPLSVQQEGALFARFARGASRRRVYLEVSNTVNGMSAKACAVRLVEHAGRGDADIALWLRERASPAPPRVAAEILRQSPRTRLLLLEPSDIPPLLGLERLLNEASDSGLTADEEGRFVAETAAGLVVVQALVEAAFDEGRPSPGSPRLSVLSRVRDYLLRTRSIVAEDELVRSLGEERAAIARAVDALAESGAVTVIADPGQGRTVVRRL